MPASGNSKIYFFIAATYIPIMSNEGDCFNNCGTFSNKYICIGVDCVDLKNPSQKISFGTQAELSNIPCEFATSVRTICYQSFAGWTYEHLELIRKFNEDFLKKILKTEPSMTNATLNISKMLFCGKIYRLNTENDGEILLSNYEQLTRISLHNKVRLSVRLNALG